MSHPVPATSSATAAPAIRMLFLACTRGVWSAETSSCKEERNCLANHANSVLLAFEENFLGLRLPFDHENCGFGTNFFARNLDALIVHVHASGFAGRMRLIIYDDHGPLFSAH